MERGRNLSSHREDDDDVGVDRDSEGGERRCGMRTPPLAQYRATHEREYSRRRRRALGAHYSYPCVGWKALVRAHKYTANSARLLTYPHPQAQKTAIKNK